MITTTETRLRIERFCYGALFASGLLMFHLVLLQVFQRHDIPSHPIKVTPLVPRRAGIYTRDGVALAVTPEGKQVCANPRAVRDKAQTAETLSSILHLPFQDVYSKLNRIGTTDRPNRYVLLKKRVDEETADQILAYFSEPVERGKAPRPPAVYLKPTKYREYPRGEFAAQLIGYVNEKGHGVDGIEFLWDEVLAGEPGSMQAEVDAIGDPIPNGRKRFIPPVEGRHVVLTIDDKIQFYAEQAAQKIWEDYKPNFVTAIVMNPKTGEILAMANKPGIDLNHIPADLEGRQINRAVNFRYEPGSTFKIVTASAVLEELPPAIAGKKFNCAGTIKVGNHTLHCWIQAKEGHGHGLMGLSDGIKNSCNIAMTGFSRYLGAERLHRFAELFGVCEPTKLGCPHENCGYLPSLKTWDAARLANVSFGQALMITPIQLLRAVAAIANDGVMMQPHVVKEIRSATGELDDSFSPRQVRRVVSVSTARRVTGMMERVVSEGTGKLAAVPGYRVAGKTGSAQKVAHRVFASGKFVSSFVGFLPAENPQIAILIVADEPKGSHWGSVVCGPAFRDIAQKSMMRMKVEPGLFAERPQTSRARALD